MASSYICPNKGYGGRISDTLLFEESNVMSVLPEKSGVMADRGFKQIQTVLNLKKMRTYTTTICFFIRKNDSG